MPGEGFHSADICRRGHVVTAVHELREGPPTNFCEKCGADVIGACPDCRTPIRGSAKSMYIREYHAPNHCFHCGKAFPWTAEGLGSLRELIAESNAPGSVKVELLKDLDALLSETPRTQIAVLRMKNFLARTGDQVVPAVRQVVIEIATASAKKTLGL